MAFSPRPIKTVMAILVFGIGLLGCRIAYLQLYRHQELSGVAGQKQTQLISGEDTPRGNILDRNGESLTSSGIEPALIVFPSMLENSHQTAQVLAKVLGVNNPGAITAMLANKSHVYFSGITEEQAKAVSEAQIYGVYSTYIKARYGSGSVARHVVGHVNSIDAEAWEVLGNQREKFGMAKDYSINDAIGVKGIEGEYESYLRARDPEFFLSAVKDARGNIIPGLSFKEVPASGKEKRNSVYLTIDKGLQEKTETVMDSHKIEKGAVVVLDIRDGDILALASRPNYNQNIIADSVIGSDKAFNNKALEYFNPGSVFKILTASAALQEGLVSLNEMFVCSGKYTLETGLAFNCWESQGHGILNFAGGLSNSCNPAFIEVALRLGRENILEYGEKFGLTMPQIIGYPVPSFKCLDIGEGGQGDVANAALGQKGVMISPLQVAGMVSVVASGGYYQVPRLVKEIKNHEGDILKSFPSGERTRVISQETANQVQQMLKEAVINGTGKNAWIPAFGSAGKTGSAETGRTAPDGKSILNVWFAGYAPVVNPRFAIVVLKEEGVSGGGDAAPVFKEIAEYALKNM